MSANNKSNNYTSHKGNSQNVEPEKRDQGKLKPSERELLRLQYESESNEMEIE
jgi:hypothetical protein